MKLSRRFRAFAALFALLGVLSSQLALAAFACPMLDPEAVAAMAEGMGEGHDCCEKAVEPSEEALCQAHCQQGDQSLDKRGPPGVDSVASLPAFAVPVAPAAARAPPVPERLPLLLARETFPSLAVRHCCLRF